MDGCVNVEPAVNLKCIVFTLVLAFGYWFLPSRNKWVLLVLLYFPYLVMAWYDHMYACARQLGPTYLAMFYWWAKPRDSDQVSAYQNWCPRQKQKVIAVDLVVLIIVLFLVWPFLKWKPK